MSDCAHTRWKPAAARPRRRLRTLLLLSFALLVVAGGPAAKQAVAEIEAPVPPRIWSDQADYAPGARVTLAGIGWGPGETVNVVVNDDGGQTWRREVDLVADENGALADTFDLPDWFVATYSVTATGPVSGTATTSFSDGNIEFQLATNDQSAPANVSWTAVWNHWQGTGQNPNVTCAGEPDITGGTTSYNGNTLASGSARPSVNNNASARPTSAQTTGVNAGKYHLSYWTTTATGGQADALTQAQLCTIGQNGGQTIRTLYAHFKPADTTAPTTAASATVTGGATYVAGSWTSKTVTIVLTAQDETGGSGVEEIHWSVGGPETVVPGATASVVVSSEGQTTVTYFARDNADNVEAPKSFVVKIDKTAPLVTVTPDRGPDSNGWYNAPVVGSAAGNDGTGSGIADCDAPATYAGPDSANASIALRCRDQAGNEGSSSFALAFDSTPLGSSASSQEFNRDSQIDVAYSVSGAGSDVSGLSGVELWVRGPADSTFRQAPNSAESGPSGTFAYGVDQGEGVYDFYTVAVDAAGNREAPADEDDASRVTSTLQDESAPTTTDDADGAWHNAAVTVHLSPQDAGSGVAATYVAVDGGEFASAVEATVPAPADHSNDGAHSVAYYSVDQAGNVEETHTATVRIDTTPPTITDAGHDPAAPDGDNGWYRQAVVTTFEAADGASGLDVACATDFPVDGARNVRAVSTDTREGGDVTVESGACADTAGNINPGIEGGPYAIDTSAPTIALASRLPAANANGWNRESVTVAWSCADDVSGVAVEEVSHTFATEGEGQTAEGTCVDEAGNTASAGSGPVSIDETSPVVSGSRTPAANAAGWNGEDVVVDFTCAESGAVQSGIDVDAVAGETVSSEGADQSVTSHGECRDKAGNEAAPASVGHISIDETPPTIAFASRLPAANAYGWNNTGVTVTWTCADQPALSGVAAAEASDTVSGEGADQTAHGSCEDRAGNQASDSVGGISIDKTGPAISIVSPSAGGAYPWTQPVAASYSCSDELSGQATCAGPVANGTNFVSLPAGSKSFQVTASDKAGNTATKTNGYAIVYAFNGFFQPIDMGAAVLNVAKSGSSIPVKFKLGGDAGLNVFAPGYPTSMQITCTSGSTLDTIETTTTSNSGLTYDPAADQYVYVWKTNSAWAGTCRQFKAAFADGRVVTASFKFAK